jgi:hypothetical protein
LSSLVALAVWSVTPTLVCSPIADKTGLTGGFVPARRTKARG